MASIRVTSICKRFGNIQAVRDVSFEAQPGEILGFLGPNGAGKTTSIRMVLDIFKPDSGQISILGGTLDVQRKRRIGYLPEERGLYKDLRVDQVLVFLATLKGLSAKEATRRLDPWLERFDLAAHRHKKVQELSKGMQQKAQLIATLLHDPELLIIDEPFSGLDPVNTRLVKEVIEELRQQGKTILMCTHQMHQVEALCSHLVLINKGQVVLCGDVQEIRRRYANNSIFVRGTGNFANLPHLTACVRENDGYRLTLRPGVSPQALLRDLAAQDDVCIDHFELAEASLDDIFVTVVGKEQEEA